MNSTRRRAFLFLKWFVSTGHFKNPFGRKTNRDR